MAVSTVQVIINGVTTSLKYNSQSGLYEADITAPAKSSFNQSKKYYPVTIKATDDAGNTTQKNDTDVTIGSSLKLTVKEKNKPVITVVSPTEDAHITDNTPTITWKVTDDDSGIKSETISIIVDNGQKITSGITKTPITSGYQCSYTVPPELSDGQHTFKFDVQDNDGNAAIQRTLNIVVDTIPPTLSIDSPTNNLITNKTTIALSGTTNDKTSNPVTVKYQLNGSSPVNVAVGSNGAFSTTLSLREGINTIIVIATDKAGKTSSITKNVELDTRAPVISEAKISPNPAETESVVHITAKVTD